MSEQVLVERAAMVEACKAVNTLRLIIEPFQGMTYAQMFDKLEKLGEDCYAAINRTFRGDPNLVKIGSRPLRRLRMIAEELEQCTQARSKDIGVEATDEAFKRLRNALTGRVAKRRAYRLQKQPVWRHSDEIESRRFCV